jgi:hypothetical protein
MASSIPVETPTARGYEPPKAIQFSVFLDNRVGRLMDLLEVFEGQEHVTLAAVSVVDSTDHAVVRLLTSRSELARRLLNRNEHCFSEVDIVVVELPTEDGLLSVCECLMHAELNIHYAYPLLVRPRGIAAIALHTDDIVLAGQLLRRHGFILLAENDLGENASGGAPELGDEPYGL